MRADSLLVERGLAESRERAQALIMEGLVYTPGGRVPKPGSPMPVDALLEVRAQLPYVSRGGIKLSHALDRFDLHVGGIVALDVGASTGGFTDCLLQHGAGKVYALDVGHGQLDYRLRQDPRVVVMEGINARYPFVLPAGAQDADVIGQPIGDGHASDDDKNIGVATIDVAFIAATKIIPQVAEHMRPGGPIIVLVKPQFEARREEVGKGGVIKDPQVHARVLARFTKWVVEAGYRLRDLVPSPILGDAGNREFFVLLRA